MNDKIFAIVLVLLAFFLSGCSSKTEESAIIATVNGKPIYLKEIKRELSIKAKQNPSLEINKNTIDDLTDTLVKRQLIIQEAMKKKMAREQKFVDTIKAFWEQTLIRDFIEYKNREFESYVFVTDKEIKDYYDDLKRKTADIPPFKEAYGQIKGIIAHEKKSAAFGDWLEKKKEKSKISINRKLISEQIKK